MLPGVLIAASIIELLHCALPNFSMYFIGLKKSDPTISTGKLFLFEIILAPNNFNGSVTLEKSLLDRLLSPIILIFFFELIRRPNISLASVPELPALIVIFLFVLYPFIPYP